MKKITLLLLLTGLCLSMLAPVIAQEDPAADCVVTSISGAVTRAGPGTDFEQSGTISAGENRTATAAEVDSAGFTWWLLVSGAWVREDLVTESSGCENITSITIDLGEIGSIACVVTSISGAVTRTGPAPSFETSAPLPAGISQRSISSTVDDAGFIWWELANGAWVREDLVTETSACFNDSDRAPEETEEAPTPDDEASCILTVLAGGANTRSEPDSESDLRGPLAEGTVAVAVDVQTDINGQNWWRLENNAWVREDLVRESDGCDDLGGVASDAGNAPESACVLTVLPGGANTRTGPSTNFEPAGLLNFGEQTVAVATTRDVNGQRWWRLANGAWVREDLVGENEVCSEIEDTVDDVEAQPTVEADTCTITSISGALLRTGPGTNYETRASLPAGEDASVISSQTTPDGLTWWQLENGAWVREDLVRESAACDEDGITSPAPAIDAACLLTAISGAVLRAEPTTDSERIGVLLAGDSVGASAQTTDTNGQIWWEIANGGWVREDLVRETDDCSNLPETSV